MSYPYAPNIWTYNTAPNGCPAYFDPGKTPLKVVISFTGIERAPAWLPGDLEPPNREFLASNSGDGCTWTFADSGYFGTWTPNPFTTQLECWTAADAVFTAAPPAAFGYSYLNNITGLPADAYKGGTVAILNMLTDTDPTIQTLADYLNFAKQANTYASATGIAQQQYVVRLDRRHDATSLRIKYDST